jgi:hypothetical protein
MLQASVLLIASHINSSPITASKAGANPTDYRPHFKGWLLTLPSNVRQGKWLSMTNELAYCTSKYHNKMVRDTIAPGGNVIKLFPLSMTMAPNKLCPKEPF